MPEQDLTIKVKQEGAEKAQQGIAGLFGQIKSMAEQLQKTREAFSAGQAASSGFGQALNLLGQGIGLLSGPVGIAAAAIGALTFGLRNATQAAEQVFREVRNLQTLTGQTAQDTSALARAFSSAGVDAGTLQAALFRMSLEAETGGKGLSRLGISLRTVAGDMKEPGQLMVEVIERIRNIGSATERSAALMQVFGRAGRGIALALSAHNESLGALVKTERERTAVTEAFMRQAALYDTATDRLGRTWEDLKTRIASTIALPLGTFFANAIEMALRLSMTVSSLVTGPLRGLQRLFGGGAETAGDQHQAEAESRRRTEFEISLTEQRLRMEEDSDRKARQIETARSADRVKTLMGSEAAALQIRLRAFDAEEQAATQHYSEMIALEMERVGKEGTISEEFILKANKTLRDRQIAIVAERNQVQSALDRARAQESAQVLSDQTLRTKAAADQQILILQTQKAQELAVVDTSNRDVVSKAAERARVEVDAALQIRDTRMSQVDSEIAGQRRLAAEYPANFELQRSVENKILELQQQRVQVENQTNNEILQSRKSLVMQMNELAKEEAQVGRSILDESLAQMEKVGRTRISLESAQRDFEKAAERAGKTAERLAAGASVSVQEFREMTRLLPVAEQMQRFGAGGAPGGFLGSFIEQARGGFQPGGPAPMRTPVTMGAADIFSLAAQQVQVSEGSLGRISATVGQAVDRLVPEVMERAFDTFTDKLIRKLEFEAARS